VGEGGGFDSLVFLRMDKKFHNQGLSAPSHPHGNMPLSRTLAAKHGWRARVIFAFVSCLRILLKAFFYYNTTARALVPAINGTIPHTHPLHLPPHIERLLETNWSTSLLLTNYSFRPTNLCMFSGLAARHCSPQNSKCIVTTARRSWPRKGANLILCICVVGKNVYMIYIYVSYISCMIYVYTYIFQIYIHDYVCIFAHTQKYVYMDVYVSICIHVCICILARM